MCQQTITCPRCNNNLENAKCRMIFTTGDAVMDHISFCGVETGEFGGLLQKCFCCDKYMPLQKLGKKKIAEIVKITNLPIHDNGMCKNYVTYEQKNNQIYIKVKNLENVSDYLKETKFLHYKCLNK